MLLLLLLLLLLPLLLLLLLRPSLSLLGLRLRRLPRSILEPRVPPLLLALPSLPLLLSLLLPPFSSVRPPSALALFAPLFALLPTPSADAGPLSTPTLFSLLDVDPHSALQLVLPLL